MTIFLINVAIPFTLDVIAIIVIRNIIIVNGRIVIVLRFFANDRRAILRANVLDGCLNHTNISL